MICSFLLALFFLRCYRWQVAVISDAEWCYEKRMNRAVDRKAELLFEYSGEFMKACRTANDINCRNLISVEEFLCDRSHFFDYGFDDREDFVFFFRSGLEDFGFFVWDAVMSGNGHSHMAAACGFVVCVDDLAIFEDADAGCTTTDIDNSSIGDLQHSSSGCRFVYDVGDFKPGTFKYISDAFDATFGNSRRDRSSGIRKFNPLISLSF